MVPLHISVTGKDVFFFFYILLFIALCVGKRKRRRTKKRVNEDFIWHGDQKINTDFHATFYCCCCCSGPRFSQQQLPNTVWEPRYGSPPPNYSLVCTLPQKFLPSFRSVSILHIQIFLSTPYRHGRGYRWARD